MASNQVILYDLPSKKTTPYSCWSPNTWKTRLILNYKNIPYQSEWLKHPDIESTLSGLGVSPNPKPAGQPGPSPSPCTLPAIKLGDGGFAMDSAVIAPVLEKQYPEPSLHLDTGADKQAAAVLGQITFPLLGLIVPLIYRNIIVPETVGWWRAKRERVFGMTKEGFEAARGGEQTRKAAEPGFITLQKFLNESKRDAGPFFLGSQVSYADFVLAAMAGKGFRLDEAFYERLVDSCEGMRELQRACGPWFQKHT